MQHDQSKITALRRAERNRNDGTPDRAEMRSLTADISAMNVSSPKRAVHPARMSMPMNTNSATLRKMELENNNLELELIYSAYVASYAELFLEQKSLKEAEVSFSNSIKAAHEETKSLLETYKSIERRIIDIKLLSCLNDYLDGIHAMINKFKEKEQEHQIQSILKELRQLLDRFSVLRCEDIILPNSPEEMEQFKKTLKNCCTLLTEIKKVFMCDELETVTADYKEFLLMCKEVSSIKKMVDEKLCDFQIENLKLCSNMLSQNEEDCE